MENQDFSTHAAGWDTPPRVRLAQDVARAIRRAVPLHREMDVLDFGCGTGLLALALLPHVRSVTGVDAAQGMLEVFRDKIRRRALDAATAVYRDFGKGTSLPSPFHLLVASMALHHVEDVDAALATFRAALLPGGWCAVADLEPEGGLFHAGSNPGAFHDGFDPEGLGRRFAAAGFAGIAYAPAAEVEKPLPDGSLKRFPVFLLTAQRP